MYHLKDKLFVQLADENMRSVTVTEDGRWNFAFDLGAMFHGSGDVAMSATAANATFQPLLDLAVEREIRDIEDDIDSFKIYPVLSFGISCRF